MNRIVVEVTEKGAGLKFMASTLKALPPAKAGMLLEVMGGDYAASLVADGYVKYTVESETAPTKPAPVDDLTKLKGVGKSTADALNRAGIMTYMALAEADTAVLAAKLTVHEDKVIAWQAAAQAIIGGN